MRTTTKSRVIEGTVPISASPESVYEHLANVEGPGFADRFGHEDGRGAMMLVAPDAQGETLLTILIEAPGDPRRAARMETTLRTELSRLGNLIPDQLSLDADDIGLDAIRDDLRRGSRETPFDR